MNVIPYLKSSSIKFDEIKDEIKPYKIDLAGWFAAAFLSFAISMALIIGGVEKGFETHHILIPSLLWLITGIGYGMNKYFISRSVEYANKNIGPPHEIIDDFLKWEDGDYIKTDHFNGSYQGLDKKQRVVLKTSSKYICLATGYFDCSSKVLNQQLKRRRKEEAKNRIEKEINEETQYDQLVSEFKKEYKSLEK